MKNIFQTKQGIWLVIFIIVGMITGFEGNAESTIKVIHLSSTGGQLKKN